MVSILKIWLQITNLRDILLILSCTDVRDILLLLIIYKFTYSATFIMADVNSFRCKLYILHHVQTTEVHKVFPLPSFFSIVSIHFQVPSLPTFLQKKVFRGGKKTKYLVSTKMYPSSRFSSSNFTLQESLYIYAAEHPPLNLLH